MPRSATVTATKKATKKEFSSAFEKAFAVLNDEQKLAVNTIEGPVMVVAGPGTGKTQVVALRVANILRKTQARPSNILCLTFSTSGATAMRDRLRTIIGSDAYGVSVNTIHGFCNAVIAEHPLVFEQWSALEQISDIDRFRELNKIIDQLLPDLVLVNKKMPHLRTGEILSAMSQLKRDGKSDPAKLRDIAKKFSDIKAGESKLGTKAHEKNLLAAKKFAEFVEVFIRYQKMLNDTGRFDYDDMILHVIKALEEEDWLLASLQERYQYFLIDEFQDTNGAQYRLIELLTQPRTPEDNPNLFVVGDDDQAIYRFQGANLTNILLFHKRFPKAPVIALTTSYRCSQTILNSATALISNNTERLVGTLPGLTKDLHSSSALPGAMPALFLTASDTTEPWLIADIIEERMKEGIAANEIAVFTQTNRELRPLYDVFRARNIPVQMSGKIDLLTHPLVSQALAILEAVENPKDNGRLAAALSCDTFGCHPADRGRLFERCREEKTSLMPLLLQFGVPGKEDPIALHRLDALIHARDTILDLHHKMRVRTIVETLECIVKDCGLLPALEDQNKFDTLDYIAVQQFFNHVKTRAYEQPHYSFDAWIADLALYRNPDYSDLRLTYEVPHIMENGVNLMTAHRSKGLEFDVVILSHFREKHWDNRMNRSGISLPEDLLFGWHKDTKAFERSQDERRVAYVAMTRARKELLFVCPKQLTTGDRVRAVSPSQFFAEAGTLLEEERELNDPNRISTLLLQPMRALDAEFKTYLLHRLQNFSLSATALEHFLEDPQKFLELDLLQMPETKKSVFVYGNAVHEALKSWAISHQKNEPLDERAFMKLFTDYMNEKEILTEGERKNLLKLGEESLPRYFQTRLLEARPLIHQVEHPVSARMEEVPLKGKIDRIDQNAPDSSTVHIIDYKTGRPETELQIREGSKFRQLAFYALLMEHGTPHLEAATFTLDFIGEGAEHPIQRTFAISAEEKADLQKKIKDVWKKILALDFSRLS
ncbi:hypothetical protein A3D88_00940 [Candidatus Peribacteria bacterium RIFCSPHIGHO2_02_FULL_52_16]|nr:MAG: hypothetical protein A2706_05585 [Candidatus Peribacteria bacterium RIFCSPHIGHO2_01_FULL_51_35]OGJ61232.1 MAG: hypothetical protein A3D88_00940 [Candidatus Peribacteria bacterium RIFCSPHIGHO2_02_FULL_52_16]